MGWGKGQGRASPGPWCREARQHGRRSGAIEAIGRKRLGEAGQRRARCEVGERGLIGLESNAVLDPGRPVRGRSPGQGVCGTGRGMERESPTW